MDTLVCGLGYTARFVITLKDEETRQPLLNVYEGTETFDVVIKTAGENVVISADTKAEWCVVTRDPDTRQILTVVANTDGAEDGTVLLTIDDADTETIGVGMHRLSIRLNDGGEPFEAFMSPLKIECR